ncbi:MAG: hypothetical protein H5T34_03275 [Candidatus Methanomethyliales bacterium]|nr:hypothetical protein [Candidatus Methanomethylicales archaeon]
MQYLPEIEVGVQEEKDWDFARNKQVLLKASMGEWSSSVFSVEVLLKNERFVGPNRDYPYQGLLISKAERVYKLLDGIMFSMEEGCAEKVFVGPYRVRYIYTDLDVELSFVEDSFQASFNRDCVRVLPFFDIRGVNGEGSSGVRIAPQGRWLMVYFDGLRAAVGPFKEIEPTDYSTEWVYKLGSGFRYREPEGYIRFVREKRKIHAPAVCVVDGRGLRVVVDGLKNDAAVKDLSWMSRVYFLEPRLRDIMILRLSTLRCFGLNIRGGWFPEAGCWWFRSPWIRDALEGIINNFQVYTQIFAWEERIRALAGMLMDVLKEKRGLPNLIGGEDYSADAPPLLLYLCALLGGELRDRAASLALELLDEMEAGDMVWKGPPVLRGGLVACAPYQSWTDSIVNGRACRLPTGWDSTERSLPKYYLPEVNGHWIRALRGLCGGISENRSELGKRLAERLKEMEGAFRQRFWDGRFVSDIVDCESNRRFEELTSMGMVGMVTAIHLFNKDEVRSAYQNFKKLVVNRTLRVLGDATLPFGVAISKRVEPYLGDEEYHRSAIWPRDTPYLIRLLEHMGLEIEIRGILLNNLDHMICEGAILYESELFGHPVGRNPHPSEGSMNPIPLKNPAQYWSHWCDPYINRFIRPA